MVEAKMAAEMATGMKFSGRQFSSAELELIVEMVTDFGSLNLTELSRTLCELLEWKRPNGGLKSLECRQMLTQLSERGWFRSYRASGRAARGWSNSAQAANRKPKSAGRQANSNPCI